MKYFLFASLILLIFSCDSSPDETTNNNIQKTDTIKAPIDTLAGYSEGFKLLMKTEKGTFRGVSLGMPGSEVKRIEEGTEVDEEGKDYIDYMIKLAEFESAEVKYILDKEAKLSTIEVNLYPKSKGSQDSLFTEFDKFLTTKYGSSTFIDSNSLKWESQKEDLLILMEKKGTQKIHDINIAFNHLSRQSASFKQ